MNKSSKFVLSTGNILGPELYPQGWHLPQDKMGALKPIMLNKMKITTFVELENEGK